MKKINKGMNLPDESHVIRHVSYSKLLKDGDGNILGFLPQAFALRPDEPELSVNWLEHLEGNHETRIQKIVQELRTVKNISSKSAFGIANVGNTKEVCKKNKSIVKIIYTPRVGFQSHAEMRDLPNDDLSLQEALATEAFCTLIHNSDIEK